MNVEIIPPAVGRVTIDMSWEDATVVAAILGQVNTGNAETVAPTLFGELHKSGFWDTFRPLNKNRHVEQRGTQLYIVEDK